ncbi:tetratricopeptide repeat protein [Microbaculum marinisediminis]|uniref:Tetratricopeptide repeat protein n=1 Tax=Microbaculum marinisediminis TaxID=2931392 RepID=A0AAW5QTU3_9HYPH|nr:tetratricopeptide repeat protein [Microbaculum sp. A6E488]MCT8970304.1 tetratricopeptide repeat protein [Microbaculum sp. A6E488]
MIVNGFHVPRRTRNVRRSRVGAVFAALAFLVPALASTPSRAESKVDDIEVHSLAGSYLAGRIAGGMRDSASAARFFSLALEADPDNLALLDRSFALSLVDGDFEHAMATAAHIVKLDPTHRVAQLALAVDALRGRQYAVAQRHLDQAGNGPLAELTVALLRAWSEAGLGDIEQALDTIASLSGPEWYEVFKPYHSGLVASVGGDENASGAYFEEAYSADTDAIRITQAWSRHLAKVGRTEEALEVLAKFESVVPNHPLINAARADIEAGRVPAPIVKTAQEGAAEVLYGIGSALGSENGEEYAAVYLRLGLYLAPLKPLATLSLADYYEKVGDSPKAIDVYASIPEGSPLRANANIHRALNLDDLDRTDEAIAVLDEVIVAHPEDVEAIIALGNILRGRERFSEAADVYTRAIDRIGAAEPRDWALFYFRGMCYERAQRWPLAELDLQKALELNPEQPHVLNYLGYSWVDQGLHLDDALDMISRAVELRPNDGYIVDSLGWAYYRLGRYEDAVRELERAVELKSEDPIINDHLGDAYWKVGRKREATFQWSHARDLDPEPDDLAKILEKLESGLVEKPDRAAIELRRNDG